MAPPSGAPSSGSLRDDLLADDGWDDRGRRDGSNQPVRSATPAERALTTRDFLGGVSWRGADGLLAMPTRNVLTRL